MKVLRSTLGVTIRDMKKQICDRTIKYTEHDEMDKDKKRLSTYIERMGIPEDWHTFINTDAVREEDLLGDQSWSSSSTDEANKEI